MSNSSTVKSFFYWDTEPQNLQGLSSVTDCDSQSIHTAHDSFGLAFIIMSFILATWLSLIHLALICLQNSCMDNYNLSHQAPLDPRVGGWFLFQFIEKLLRVLSHFAFSIWHIREVNIMLHVLLN